MSDRWVVMARDEEGPHGPFTRAEADRRRVLWDDELPSSAPHRIARLVFEDEPEPPKGEIRAIAIASHCGDLYIVAQDGCVYVRSHDGLTREAGWKLRPMKVLR